MKAFITAIAITLTALSATAGHKSSAFSLKMFDNGSFSVVLDNKPFRMSNAFSIPKIEPGYHKLKVIRYVLHPCGTYMQQVAYKGWITIPPKSVVYSMISCHNQYNVVKVEPYFCPPAGGGCGNGWDDDCEDEYGYGYETGGNGWGPPVPPPPPAPVCMSPVEFMQLKTSIVSKSFDSSKLQVARQALGYNYFSSAQIADLMLLFSFESSRLEFAKNAYAKVLDKHNFYIVNNAFTFESSIQELNQFIAMGK